MGRDSVDGTVTRYGLDGPRIESRGGGGGEIFHTCPATYTMNAGSLSRE